jgi:hypothetical protein
MSTPAALWLLPAAFVLHDAEELLTMVGWLASHRVELEQWSSRNVALRRLVESVPSSNREVAITMVIELAFLIAVTAFASRSGGRRSPFYIYAAALGAFVLHASTHALQAVVFAGYVPGVVTAASIIPAVGVVLYGILLRRGLLSIKAALTTATIGIVVLVPLFMLFVRVARRVDGML